MQGLFVSCLILHHTLILKNNRDNGLSVDNTHCYGPNTGSGNLQKHLHLKHRVQYMDAAKKYNWTISKSLDAQDKPAMQSNSHEHQFPEYSYDVFVQYLICFIVANDQVSAATQVHLRLSFPFQSSHFALSIAPNFVISAGFSNPTLKTSPVNSICESDTIEWARAFMELHAELTVSQGTPECV
jgi:hypothetical protein